MSISSPLTRPSPNGRRVGIRIGTFEACPGFTRVTVRRIAQPPIATFVTRLQPSQLPNQAARQLPDLSTSIRVDPSSTGVTRRRGALPRGAIQVDESSVVIGSLNQSDVVTSTKSIEDQRVTVIQCCKRRKHGAEQLKLEGGCYCGKLRYVAEGKPTLKAQCHCRECQYISGGAPNFFMLMPNDGFNYVVGTPKQFKRTGLKDAVTREFCSECGTHMITRRPGLSEVVLKVGTLDDPAFFDNPRIAIFTIDKQPFHYIPEGIPTFEHLPRR